MLESKRLRIGKHVCKLYQSVEEIKQECNNSDINVPIQLLRAQELLLAAYAKILLDGSPIHVQQATIQSNES